jgi:hypothetical protein
MVPLMRLPKLLILVLLIVLSGCAAERMVFVPKNAAVPVGVNFSGLWQLREDSADTVREITEAERKAAGSEESILVPPERETRNKRRRRADGMLVHVFLETGSSLKITQTADGLFISFDRAVVEEYRFGEHREINVGPVEAERVSGWEGATYVIETLDKEGAKLIETYRLADGDRRLLRTIRIEHKEDSHLDIAQAFDRSG